MTVCAENGGVHARADRRLFPHLGVDKPPGFGGLLAFGLDHRIQPQSVHEKHRFADPAPGGPFPAERLKGKQCVARGLCPKGENGYTENGR